MKIAFVHDFLLRLGGAERVLKVLMDMYPEAPVYTLLYDKKKCGEVFPAERVKTSSLQKWPRFLPGMHKFMFPFMPGAIEQFDLGEYDVVVSSSGAYSHGVITNLDTTHICYYHSPMRYAWDYTHKYLKEQNLGGIGEFLASGMLHKVRIWDFLAADRVDVPLANSETVAGRIRKYYRQEAEVVHPPVDVSRFEPHAKHEGYFLIVSALTPYKRIDLAVELFNKLGKRLVIIGDGKDRARLERMAASNIDFLGFKPDEVVKEYFENCRAFIFPGEEDFGIAPIEAMACGKPVLAFRKGGLLETMIEGKTGQFFDEQTASSMEDGLTQLLINEKDYEPEEIAKHAQKFSTENFKKKMKSLIESARIGYHKTNS
jgi:glycosyltransferase involved in cell wall biosynthesis